MGRRVLKDKVMNDRTTGIPGYPGLFIVENLHERSLADIISDHLYQACEAIMVQCNVSFVCLELAHSFVISCLHLLLYVLSHATRNNVQQV